MSVPNMRKEQTKCQAEPSTENPHIPPNPPANPITSRRTTGFPTERRPTCRPYSTVLDAEVNEWFESSAIVLGNMAITSEQIAKARRLCYTWRDCFATRMSDIKPTDLIEHAIDLRPNATPCKSKPKRYTRKEIEFAAVMFPEMEEADIVADRGYSEWGARTQFPIKADGKSLRVVHNYIPLNDWTIKPAYPTHCLEEVLDNLLSSKFTCFFSADAAHGYWAVPLRPGDEYKTGFLTPHGQYFYRRMGQGLKGSPHTYSMFSDLVFGPIPRNCTAEAMPSLIGQHGDTSFGVFMDDHVGAATDFDALCDFLHTRYFPRVAFGPVYLSQSKLRLFCDSIEVLGFTASNGQVRPGHKHRSRIQQWPVPTSKAEVEAFLYQTPFLRIFIPGRADHDLILRRSYQTQVTLPLKDPEAVSVRRVAMEIPFVWGPEQQESFQYIKDAICNNAMAGADHDRQYHLATDASNTGIGGILFQVHEVPPNTEATDKLRSMMRIIMFMSYRLADVETRYTTTEKEALAVVRCLAEVRWLVVGSPFATMIYTDHQALLSILNKGTDTHGRIARWMDRLTEYDYIVHHRPNTANIIRIADGLSRLPRVLQDAHTRLDEERMAMPAAVLEEQNEVIDECGHDPFAELRQDPLYNDIIDFLLYGVNGIKELHRSRRRQIQAKAVKFRIAGRRLVYIERNHQQALCITGDRICQVLQWAHDCHGHFAAALTIDRLIGQFYWTTRVKDVEEWCRSCDVCQRMGHRHKSAELRPILQFRPWAMVGMDFLGPVKPVSEGLHNYVLVVVDYFTKMVFATAVTAADKEAVMAYWLEHLAPIFGWPIILYTDNGSHFDNHEVRTLFETHGSIFICAPISHPQSVGMIERMVQLVASQIRKWVIERGPTSRVFWNRALSEAVLAINTRLVRTHGFHPADMMLGYVPEWLQKPLLRDDPIALNPQHDQGALYHEALLAVPGQHWAFLWEHREQERDRLATSVAVAHGRMEGQKRPQWTKPLVGDLVLVRAHALDKEHGRKLDSRWLGPRLLVEYMSPVSASVRNVYGDGKTKKYHIDDLKTYIPRVNQPAYESRARFPDPSTDIEALPSLSFTIDQTAMKYAGRLGSRFLNLLDPSQY